MAEPSPPKQRIFIVEDESIVVADLAQILTGMGYEVAGTAVSGPQAIAAINADPPDLVLMDIVLQGPLDGIETATHIRARHDVPIVYLTAYSDPEIISRAKNAEPYGYLIKPLAERELHATIELALAKSRVENRLRASEERYRILAETAQDFIFTIGRDGTIQYVNRYGAEQFGVTPAAMLGQRPADMFPPDVAGKQQADLERVFTDGEPLHLENQVVFPVGGLRWLDTHLFPLRDSQGVVETILGISRDVTDRRKNEEASRAAARQWQSTFDAVTDAICMLDAEGRIERCNRGMTAMFGLDEQRVVGRHCWELVHQLDQPIPDCPFIRARHSRRRETIEVEQDGRWFEVTVDPFLDEQGAVTGAVHIMRDITARREAGKRIRAMNEELVAANRELQSLDAMKSNLLSTVSHELRTPLVSIRGYIEMISEGKSGPVNDRQREQIGIAIRSIERLGVLINSLLDYSRLELGHFRLHRSVFDLRALVRETVQVIFPKAHDRGLALELEPGGEPVPVWADHDRITQVCLNLIDNAIKFSESGGRIMLRVEAMAGRWGRVTVSDTGIGIPVAEQTKVFQRFYQVDGTPTRRRGGMGIGLALCHELIKLHDGEITVASCEGAGSTFAFTIPLAGGLNAESAPAAGSQSQ